MFAHNKYFPIGHLMDPGSIECILITRNVNVKVIKLEFDFEFILSHAMRNSNPLSFIILSTARSYTENVSIVVSSGPNPIHSAHDLSIGQ